MTDDRIPITRHKKRDKRMLAAIGDKFAGLRKRPRIILVIGTWLLVVTILLAFGL